MRVLDDILAAKQREIPALRARRGAETARLTLDVKHALARPSGGKMRIVAEVKHKSPSAGELSRALSPGARARVYAEAGAAMVSVLCDGPFFGGSYDDLAAARRELDAAGLAVPLLAKEFIVDEAQLDAARAAGADAALLIARILPGEALGRLVRATEARGLAALVEVATEEEVASALSTGAQTIGVNARDLDTLAMDAARAARVLAAIPASCVAVHLSGIGSPEAVRDVARGRADAALVGEALMRQDDPAPLLRALLAAS